jgi:hypothetical protein
VPDNAAFSACDLIWLVVPDAMLDWVVRDLAAQTQLATIMMVVCGSMYDSRWPAALIRGPAHMATLNVIEGSEERALVAEGHPEVIRELRRLTASEGRKLIEIRPGAKGLYFAGVNLATWLTLPWIGAAVEGLRAAGFPRPDATRVVQALGKRSLNAYGKAGHKAWGALAAPELRRSVERDLEAIRAADPNLASLYTAGIDHALGYFEGKKRVVGSG